MRLIWTWRWDVGWCGKYRWRSLWPFVERSSITEGRDGYREMIGFYTPLGSLWIVYGPTYDEWPHTLRDFDRWEREVHA